MKNNLFLNSMLLGLIIVLSGCEDKSVLIRMSIFPTGVFSETYLITINNSGEYEVVFGEKNNSDIDDENYLTGKKKSTKKLSREELDTLIALQKKIGEYKEITKEHILKGGWEVMISTKGKKYNFYFNEQKDNALGSFVEALINLSPLKIDIHSWS